MKNCPAIGYLLSAALALTASGLGFSPGQAIASPAANKGKGATTTNRGKAEKPALPTVFQRLEEPEEKAFSMLVPQGWIAEGGVFRSDHGDSVGSGQTGEAKLDFTAKSDATGKVMLRRYPDWYYIDVRYLPPDHAVRFHPGSNYRGMTVGPPQTPVEHILQVILPGVRSGASRLTVVEQRDLPGLAREYGGRREALGFPSGYSYSAAAVTADYDEGGTTYRERVITIIENCGSSGNGQWINRETVLLRTPASEFSAWEPVFDLMIGSTKANPRWTTENMHGIMARLGILPKEESRIQEIDRGLPAHAPEVVEGVRKGLLPGLDDREKYLDPFTGEVEHGSRQLGRYRWQTEAGDVLYSDREAYDPRKERPLNRSDWRRSVTPPPSTN